MGRTYDVHSLFGGDYVFARVEDIFKADEKMMVIGRIPDNNFGMGKCIFNVSDESKVSDGNLIVRLHNDLKQDELFSSGLTLSRPIRDGSDESFYQRNQDVMLYSFFEPVKFPISSLRRKYFNNRCYVGNVERILFITQDRRNHIGENNFLIYNLFRDYPPEMQMDDRTGEPKEFYHAIANYLSKQRKNPKANSEPRFIAIDSGLDRKSVIRSLNEVIEEENEFRKRRKSSGEMMLIEAFPY